MVLRAAQTNLSEEKPVSSDSNSDATNEELDRYRNTIKQLESRLAECIMKNEEYERNSIAAAKTAEVEAILKEKVEELEKLRKDQEDLLELLTDQDSKIMLYKEKLEVLGAKVVDSKKYLISYKKSLYILENLFHQRYNLI